MANYYVWSGATGSANGTSWANAYTTLTTAYSGKAAGDVFYVAQDHAESTAGAVTLTSPGSFINPAKVICTDRAGSVPPVSADRRTTAQVSTTAANSMTITGYTHYDGIIFSAGTGTSSSAVIIVPATSDHWLRFDNCSLRLGISSATPCEIRVGGNSTSLGGTHIEFNNTTVSFANANHTMTVGNTFKWRNTASALLGTAPTILFTTGARGALVEIIGVDVSAAGSGKTLVSLASTCQGASYRFVDCKLDAAATKVAAITAGHGVGDADFIRSGAGGINYAIYRLRCAGTLIEETTIVRTGGATDGTTPISWKAVTTANCTSSLPFECPPIAIWNDITGSARTATIEGIWGGGAVPNNDDVWVGVEYLGDASSPQGSFVSDGKADLLATAAGQTSSSATWGGSTTKFKLDVAFTAQQKGWIYARVKCAKASSTFYIDPLVTLT